jgi:hypothetical protein
VLPVQTTAATKLGQEYQAMLIINHAAAQQDAI